MNPSKHVLENVAILRYKLAATAAILKSESVDAAPTEDLLSRVMEDADSVLASGEIPDWIQLRRILSGTLDICKEHLNAHG